MPSDFSSEQGGPAVATTVTVALGSRNRPEWLIKAVQSILGHVPEGTPVIVVDQSDEPSGTLEALAADGKIDYYRDPGRGLSRGQNIALRRAETELVAFIDDDCEIDEQTIPSLVAAMSWEPAIGLAFGTVYADVSVSEAGFIPTYEPPTRAVLRGRLGKLRDGGISACMIVRRAEALAVGGLDERLGPGTSVDACEDGEFAYRMLQAGHGLAHEPKARVLHHGLRPWGDGAEYAYRTFRGIGAAYALHLRAGDPVAVLLIGQQLLFALGEIGSSTLRGRPHGVRRFLGLLAGIPVGLRMKPLKSATAGGG